MSRQARQAYKELKIPEADPIWDHVRYREDAGLGTSARSAGGPSATTAPKKGVLSKGTTKKKAEGTRKKVPDIIIAKDESVRPVKDASSAKGKARERDVDEGSAAGTPTSATRPPIRRLPGSGYKVKASATPPAPEDRANSPLPPPPPKRTGPVDARESRRELPAPSGSAKPLPPIAPPSVPQEHKAASSTPQFRKKTKDATAERTLEERREERQRERERQAAAEERQRAKGQASPLPAASASLKRKKLPQDGNDSEYSEREVPLSAGSPKKRRMEEQQSAASDKARVRDLSLPKKPVTHEPSPLSGSRPKVKKEPSPLSIAFSPPPSAASRSSLPPRPSLPEKPQPPSSSSSSTKEDPPHRASSTSKRRRSPVYTSSEDESDSHRPSRARASGRAAEEEPAAKKAKTKHAMRFRPRDEMPSDRVKLRRYYKSCWRVYIGLYQEQALRRDRIERMLHQNEDEDGAEGSEDEGDVEELDPDALMAFMEELKAVTEEMNRIKEQWKRLGGTVAELEGDSKSP